MQQNSLIPRWYKPLVFYQEFVEIDETEQGDRALLNFGHTFGHALESYFDYSEKLLHGEAVSLGMVLAARFSNQEGYLSESALEDINDHLKVMKLPTAITQVHNGKLDVVKLLTFMKQDKKVVGHNINLILLKDIGNGFIERNVSFQKLEKFLQVQLS